jgi:hypothetical protein
MCFLVNSSLPHIEVSKRYFFCSAQKLHIMNWNMKGADCPICSDAPRTKGGIPRQNKSLDPSSSSSSSSCTDSTSHIPYNYNQCPSLIPISPALFLPFSNPHSGPDSSPSPTPPTASASLPATSTPTMNLHPAPTVPSMNQMN